MTANDHEVVRYSRDLLAKHARSFRWAAVFLPTAQRDDAAVLYAFCRAVDDAADESLHRDDALRALRKLQNGLHHPAQATPLTRATRAIVERRGLPLVALDQLIEAARPEHLAHALAVDQGHLEQRQRATPFLSILNRDRDATTEVVRQERPGHRVLACAGRLTFFAGARGGHGMVWQVLCSRRRMTGG